MAKIYIVEDECGSRDTLLHLLRVHFPGNEIYSAQDLRSAHALFSGGNPDLAILDIEYPDGTAFDLLNSLNSREFKLIFVTGYEKYAIQAFKFSATHFLLKPYIPEELVRSVGLSLEKVDSPNVNQKLIEALLENFSSRSFSERQIVLKTLEEIHVINTRNIVHCLADNNYTTFYLADSRSIIVSRPIKEYEDLLSEYKFMRVHQSHLVNLLHIKKFDKRDGGSLVMNNDSRVPVSTRKRQVLMDYFAQLEHN